MRSFVLRDWGVLTSGFVLVLANTMMAQALIHRVASRTVELMRFIADLLFWIGANSVRAQYDATVKMPRHFLYKYYSTLFVLFVAGELCAGTELTEYCLT